MGSLSPPRLPWPARAGIVAAYVAVFWVLLPAALWWLAARLDPAIGWRPPPLPAGILPLAAGIGLLAWGIAALWTRGGGLPVTALPPPRLARLGPYRHCRHPIYLGFNLAVLGWGLVVGSAALAFVIAPLLLPAWVLYATTEERGLLRRFGPDYARYKRQVGLFPRWGLYRLSQLVVALRVIPLRVEGRQHVPRHGPCVLVSNHACYLDPCFTGAVTRRLVHFTTTAEAYREGVTGVLVRRYVNVPVRRYRVDPTAMREVLRLLAEGEIVGMYPEGERSPLGDYQGAMADVAGILSRLPVPVIPVGISGAYDVGPRWAQVLRRRPVRVRVGPPLSFGEGDPVATIDRALRALIDEDPQPVHLAGLPMQRMGRVLWACPACFCAQHWDAAALRCAGCGARWTPTDDGRLRGPHGEQSLADLPRPLWTRPEADPLTVEAEGLVEHDLYGPLQPLRSLGRGRLVIDAQSLRFGGLSIEMADIRSCSTERADTLQVATATGMWQFRTAAASVFRLHRAVQRWAAAARKPPSLRTRPTRPTLGPTPPPPPRWRLPTAGAAVGLGLVVTESAFIVRPLMEGFGAGGAGGPLLVEGLAWVGLGALLDLLGQALTRSGSPWVRGGLSLAGLASVILASGQVAGAVLIALAGAALWAVALHGPALAVASAILAATWALTPSLPRPAPPLVASTAAPASGPSMALVVLDTLRKDRATPWRSDGRDTTPALAALATRGTRFDRAWATSCWSLPSHASMLTGRMPTGHGAHYEHLHLDDALPTLPALLTDAGYATAGFSANPLVAPGTGLARGFSHFAEPWRTYTLREALVGWRVATRWLAPDRDKGGAAVVDALRAWLDDRPQGRPFFVLVNLMEAHVPYQEVPRRWRRRYVDPELSDVELEALGERSEMAQVLGTAVPDADRAATLDLLDGATAAADDDLRQVLAAVEAADPHTLVVVVADHGDLLGEHGLWGHNLGLWEPLLDVPFVVAGPGVAEGRVLDAPVSLLDLFPTLLGAAGVPAPASDGLDLGPLLRGDLRGQQRGDALADRVLRAEHLRTDFLTGGWQLMDPLGDHGSIRARRAAARQGDRKRILVEDGGDQGFDLSRDPTESDSQPGAATGIPLALPVPGSAAPALLPRDPGQAEALRALGYLR